MRQVVLGTLGALLFLPRAGAQDYGATAAVKREPRGEEIGASDFRLEIGELARVPRDSAQKLLTLAPGLLLTNHGGEGHAASIFLRGFDAGEGEDLELTVDGVPLNEVSNHHGHGYADTSFVMPEVVRSLRVIEGAFDPAQGDFAVAGSADYMLGVARPGARVSVGVGGFRRRRLSLTFRPEGERVGTFAAAALERGDGFGVSRGFGSANVLGQYDAKLGAGTYVRTLAAFGAQRWDTAGIVRESDYRARGLPCAPGADHQFFCTPDPNQGGSGHRVLLSTILERTGPERYGRAQLFFTQRALRTRENFTGFSLDPRSDGGPQRGDLRDGRTEALTVGLRASARRALWLFGQRHDLELGVYGRHDVVSAAMDRVRRELDVPYLSDFDRRTRQTNVALYGRLDARLFPRLRLTVGLRGDAFAFSVLEQGLAESDRIGPRLSRAAFDAYGFALSVRGGADLQIVDGLDLLVGVGQGARSSDATALSEAESAPFARVLSAEVGLKLVQTLADRVDFEARATAFTTRVSRDLLFDAEAGRNEPIGASHRSGALATMRAALASWFDLLGSATYTRAHLSPPGAAPYQLAAGPRLPFVPTWLVRGDAVVSHGLGLADLSGFASLGVTYVGKRPLPLGAWADPYEVIDVGVGARYRFIDLSAQVTNLFDARYRESEFHHVSNFTDPTAPRSMFPARHFSAGAPRQWLLTIALALDATAAQGGST